MKTYKHISRCRPRELNLTPSAWEKEAVTIGYQDGNSNGGL